MRVNDVATDADVGGDRHAQPPTGSRHAQMSKRTIVLLDGSADRFAQTLAAIGRLKDDVVESTRFAPQPELSAANPFRDVFAGAATGSQLVVVDDAGTVGGHVRDQAAFHQIDQVARKPQL